MFEELKKYQAEGAGGGDAEPITDENVEDCFQMAMEWRREEGINDEEIDPELEEVRSELAVSLNALRLMKELRLTGGCLRVNSRVCAFKML